MIDLHTHILPNTDDGSKSTRQSLNMLREAKNAGFNIICCTPHYLEQKCLKTRKENIPTIRKLREDALKNNIDVKIELGNEIYINEGILEEIEEKKVSCIGKSNYLLVELPMKQELKYLDEIFLRIIEKGYRIVIAHPERYTYVQKDPNYLVDFIKMGIYFQGNYGSVIGRYGKTAEKTIRTLLKNNLIHILSTDAHTDNSMYLEMDEINKKILKIIDEEYLNLLSSLNPKLLLKNENLLVPKPKIKKDKFFK